MTKVLVITEELANQVVAKRHENLALAQEVGGDMSRALQVGALEGAQELRAVMTELSKSTSVNLFCDSLAVRVSPSTKKLLQQFLEALLAHIKEAEHGD